MERLDELIMAENKYLKKLEQSLLEDDTEDNDNKIQVKMKITRSELYEFIMYHNYVSVRGVISVLFSLISTAGTIVYWTQFSPLQKVLMLFMSLMFIVITPIEYYVRAGRQAKKSFQNEITYIFDKSGITIQIEKESSHMQWEDVMKVISTKNLVLIYFSPVRAFIIAKKDISDEFENIKTMMSENTNCYQFKMER